MSDFLTRISQYSQKRLALLADELQGRVQELEGAQHEPIAIVGIGCRLPGGVRSPEQLWKLVRDGVDAISEVPADRWDIDALYDPDADAPGKMSTRSGGFIDKVDQFDPHFFGISPREAQNMDPQQRVLMEVTWEALEYAGISPQRLENTPTSVYLGISAADYYQIIRSGGIASLDAYTASGVAHSIASGRLSYYLGIRGPSVSIDTACSSSLVAIHHAVNSLRRGESNLALAGGVNLVLAPEITIALSKAKMLAPDGRCKAFDSRANGFVRGEGCGMLVLKRLSDAQRDGDRIVALIRGTASNQDGRSNGLTAPNGPSQEDVLRRALANAKVRPEQIGFVEAHGTGTSLGDPIEVQALGAVLGAQRAESGPLLVGSVKANIGHLEACAGVAGLIKLAMALKHGEVPGQIHVRTLNPHIAWDELAVRVPTSLVPWPQTGGRRLGGVSSFGFSGTNVHIVLEQAPEPVAAPVAPSRAAQVLTVSARTEAALPTLARAYAEHLRNGAVSLADVAHTLNAGRAHFPHRAAFVASSATQAADILDRLASGVTDAAPTGVAPARAPRVAFLFTGQGSQYVGMACTLFETQPLFRSTLEKCDQLLRPHLPQPLLSVLFPAAGESSPIDETQYTQPALFAVEYALATLWMSWGVRPAMVMGHSVGEVVAACVAGVFSLEDALQLIAARGRLMGALPRGGGMVALLATEAQAQEAIAPFRSEVSIAALNGPTSIVISGPLSRLEQITAQLQARGVKCTPLTVSHAFHSPLMRPMIAEFERTLSQLKYSPPQIDLVSNVTGKPAGAAIATAAYWSEHVLAAVQFAPAVQSTVKAGCEVMLEIGPRPVLLGMARQCVADSAIAWLPSLREGKDDWTQMLESLAGLYTRGVDIDWTRLDPPGSRSRVTLPGYPFQRDRYWVARSQAQYTSQAPEQVLHPLLGNEIRQSATRARVFESRIDVARLPYFEDHVIRGRLLLPSPAFMEMSLAGAAQQFRGSPVELEDFTVHQPLKLEPSQPGTVQLVIEPPADGVSEIRISSFDESEDGWLLHASGRIRSVASVGSVDDVESIRARTTEAVNINAYYEWLSSLGLEFGPRFRAAQSVRRRDGEVFARMQVAADIEADLPSYSQHPAVIDACLHLIGAALPGKGMTLRDPFLLLNVEKIRAHARLQQSFWVHIVQKTAAGQDPDQLETFRADLVLLDDSGRRIAEYLGLHLKRARAEATDSARIAPRVRAMIHEIAWRETSAAGAQLPAPASIAGKVTPLLPQLAESNGLDAYAGFIPGLDALASAYVVRGLRALGFELKPGERFETEALRKRLGVLDKYQRLFARMLVMLAEDALLIADSGQWRVLRSPPDASADEICDQLLARHPDAAAELSLTRRCGQSLAAVLRGKADPMPLLFPEGSLAETESLYQKSPPARTYNGLIAQMFAACRAGVPADRPLRILEIGAGTGSTTAYVLEQLKDLPAPGIEYTFTDVSPLFLKRAAEKFGNPSYMRFKLFDAGADPKAQGFEPGYFDIVVGANVLHATPDLDVTVANVRKVMRPSGLLILLEGATPQRFGDLTVGLLDGWWCYTDTHRRDYALMPREGWLKLFADQGFADAVAIPGAASGPVLSQQAIYVAQVPADQSRAPARHIVIADRKGFALPVSQALRANGDAVEIISPEHPAGLAATLRTALGTPCANVIFLPALDVAVEDGASSDSVLADQQSLLSAALTVTQTLASRVGITARLWTVTRGGQATKAGESANPAQATLWGMSHVVALEHPELSCTRLDLDPAATAPLSATALAAEVRGAGREDQIALRGSQRFTRRLARHAASAESKAGGLPINGEKSYLITGGLRGLGLRVAEWLAEQGAKHIALMGRGAPDERAQQAITRLQARGVTVTVCRGDVGVRKDVERALATIAAGSAPLGGVIHAAGVLDDGVISAQTWPRFATVMGPKVTGTWHLHSLTRDLDFFVLFSSGASLAGSPGQSNHAAANAFEDALAWYRQARGLPTVSINWGPWAEIGAAADRTIGATGLRPIAPADGLAALDHAMRTPSSGRLFSPAQLAVFATDWAHLVAPATTGGLSPLFTDLAVEAVANARRNPGTGADRLAEAPLPERLRSAAPNRRKTVLRDFVRQQAVKVLGMPRPEDLDVNEPLRQLGLDSLMAVELRNVLGKAVSRTLPATVTFDYPSVAALVEFLGVEVFAAELGETPREAEAPATPSAAMADTTADAEAADLESLNEEELALQLAARLAGIGRDRD